MQEKSIAVAVLDFGGETIKLALAEKYVVGEGQELSLYDSWNVIFYDFEPVDGAIVRGVIRNLSDTAFKVRRLLTRAEEATGIAIRSIYVLVDGQGLQSKMYSANIEFSSPHEIQNSDLVELLNLVTPEPNKYSFDNPYARFYVGGTYAERPVGVKGLNLRGEFQFFQTEQYVIENIYDVLENKLDLEVLSFRVAPALLGERFLTDEQKRIGSAVIDFGAETTSVAIYKNGFLEGLRVLPMGSRQITNDLTFLQISPSEAERLKKEVGSVLLDFKENDPISVTSPDMLSKKEVTLYRVNQYIEARMREIVDNIKKIIEQFVGAEKLVGGIIITGGGSKLKGLQTYLIDLLGTTVEYASFKTGSDARNAAFLSHGGTLSLYSMMATAVADCRDFGEEPMVEPAETSDLQEVPVSESYEPQQRQLFPEDELLDDETPTVVRSESVAGKTNQSRGAQPVKKKKRERGSNTGGFLDNLKRLLPFDWDEMESDDETV